MAYVGFDKLKSKIAAKGGVRDPGAVAAAIGRKKYGKAKFQKAAASGHKMKGMSTAHHGSPHTASSAHPGHSMLGHIQDVDHHGGHHVHDGDGTHGHHSRHDGDGHHASTHHGGHQHVTMHLHFGHKGKGKKFSI